MRSNLERNKAYATEQESVNYGVSRLTLTGNLAIPTDGPWAYFLDCGGSARTVTLPALRRGASHCIFNQGAANSITVKNAAGATLLVLAIGDSAHFLCSGLEWRYLTNTVGDPFEPTEISSPGGTISTTVVVGALQIDVIPGAVDHNALLNYVADQHVAHSGVTLTAGAGLSGGGTIAASRTLTLDVNDLTVVAPVLGDSFPFADLSDSNLTRKATLTTLNGILDHDALLNFSANKHIDHTTVSISAGTGLTGGGTIAATRTLSIDINGLSADTPATGDFAMFYDISGADTNKVTYANLITALTIFSGTVGATANVIPKASGAGGITLQASTVLIDGSGNLAPVTNDVGALGTTSLKWADAFFASGAVIDFNSGDVTITHAANSLAFAGASSGYSFDAVVQPTTNDAAALGSTSLKWSDLFLASGGVIDFNSGDVTITHSANILTFGGAANGYKFDAAVLPSSSDGAALGSTSLMWSDLFLASGGVVDFNSGDVTITHSANVLTFGGASSGYKFDAAVLPSSSDGAAVGSGTLMWSDLFVASGAVLNFNNGDYTITHSTGLLTFSAPIVAPQTGAASFQLLDDTATSITIPGNTTNNTVTCQLVCNSSTAATFPTAHFVARSRGTAQAPIIFSQTTAGEVVGTTGALSGTTGADAKLNVSVNNDGKIYIENRLGGTRTFQVVIKGYWA